MPPEQPDARGRAEALREQTRKHQAPPSLPAGDDASKSNEMLPGESPNDYVQRRMRELEQKKRAGG